MHAEEEYNTFFTRVRTPKSAMCRLIMPELCIPYYGEGRYWAYGDRDGDGDFWRHRYHRHWYGDGDADDGYYGGWGNRGWGRVNNGWYNNGWYNNGPWNGNTPPGWQHGRKRGWGNSDLPPGQAKKQGRW